MSIDKDNTIHFLRDSSWYNGNFTEFYLLYSKIPDGDLTQRTEILLPKIPDSLETTGHLFVIPNDKKPLCVIPTYTRSGSKTYYFYTKYNTGEFSEYEPLDSLRNDEIVNVSAIHILPINPNKLYLFYRTHFLKTDELQYNVLISSDDGLTFNKPMLILEEAFYTNLHDYSFLYAIEWVYRKQGIMYYKFNDIFSTSIDSAFLGNYFYSISCLNKNGGKNVIVTNSQNKSFFIGKDIITSVNIDENRNENRSGDVSLNINPNPFNNFAIISFTLPKEESINITVFDVNGRKVKEIQNFIANSGENKITFEADNLASGIYIVTLRYNNKNYTTKGLLVK